MRHAILSTALVLLGAGPLTGQSLYFPPLGPGTWDTLSPSALGWCPDRLDSLIDFVGSRNTKAFLILKDGKIVLEHYYGTFTQDSLWYWASAGKTLTAMLTGIAQEEGFLGINQPSSAYLGTGWTSCSPPQEAQITVWNQLTMTSGLDDGMGDPDCTDPACLQYLADAGTRWAYHNAPYTLLDDVIANATGTSFSNYFNTRIRNRIGMDGLWLPLGYNKVYFSRARSMARFGLLALNRGVWANDTILHDTAYFTAMTTPSQGLNESYGHLWWLNGQPSFMLPGLQFVFPGPAMPDAPADMICGLGKNDQLLNVVPSRNMVVVRLGNEAYGSLSVATIFNNEIWQLIEQLPCATAVGEQEPEDGWGLHPNPATDLLRVVLPPGAVPEDLELLDERGRSIPVRWTGEGLDLSDLATGTYAVRIRGERPLVRRFLKR
ncbi:MAG TPA: serine hydrolase [Flavobacteriales bacterium]|nr:serine hydrolase [Flavobacteriales bacterium]HMR28396.1 serine hydrolase [Flavobacteriales bacterium]